MTRCAIQVVEAGYHLTDQARAWTRLEWKVDEPSDDASMPGCMVMMANELFGVAKGTLTV
jgi:hypothetical protein